MFEKNKETGKWIAMHHLFIASRDDRRDLLSTPTSRDDVAIESIVAAGYDIVLNGSEIAGRQRPHPRPRGAEQGLQTAGPHARAGQEKFSFLLEAPFARRRIAGIAFGFDRLIMHVCGTDNIRDVIAFPKTQIGADLMTRPERRHRAQLKEVHIKSTWVPPEKA